MASIETVAQSETPEDCDEHKKKPARSRAPLGISTRGVKSGGDVVTDGGTSEIPTIGETKRSIDCNKAVGSTARGSRNDFFGNIPRDALVQLRRWKEQLKASTPHGAQADKGIEEKYLTAAYAIFEEAFKGYFGSTINSEAIYNILMSFAKDEDGFTEADRQGLKKALSYITPHVGHNFINKTLISVRGLTAIAGDSNGFTSEDEKKVIRSFEFFGKTEREIESLITALKKVKPGRTGISQEDIIAIQKAYIETVGHIDLPNLDTPGVDLEQHLSSLVMTAENSFFAEVVDTSINSVTALWKSAVSSVTGNKKDGSDSLEEGG